MIVIDPTAHDAPEFALPSRLQDASFFTATPFPIFEFDDFLPPAFYDRLVADVQTRTEFDATYTGTGNKKKLSVTAESFHTLAKSPFKSLVARVMSDGFFDWFAATHLPYFKDGPTHGAVAKRSDFRVEVHYSSIQQGCFIPPHTDSPTKRLSFVLYLPAEPLPEDMQINCGTRFYGPRHDNAPWDLPKSGLLGSKRTRAFVQDHRTIHVSRFRPNRCVGFIKSGVSWHAVAPIQAAYDRRAIVINIHAVTAPDQPT